MVDQAKLWSRVSTLMHKETGVLMEAEQAYLLESRLQPLMHMFNVTSVEAVVEMSCSPTATSKIRMAFIDAMTTHESYFFRDSGFWGAFQNEVVKDFQGRNKKALRIWSAACSYGQEAYSVAMLLQEIEPALLDSVQIVASDVSEAALERGREGLYTTVEVNRGVSATRLIKHFQKAPGGFLVKEALRKKITWASENLLKASHAANRFDVVLCRNVLIYFDQQDRRVALTNLVDSTNNQGYIGLGTSEVLLKPQFAPGWHKKTERTGV